MNKVRCAIYTRKSSEEGLGQDFNSLDAQREACAAYVASQASEGWALHPQHYDDGGLSGGTLERPALQRLLSDIEAGAIDIIVVYKVDRLTRSLLDFARLVEAFDAAKVSFVSVTQSFNTTTSIGRLTLNMLLSFAQFEREVTAERIRDKIAASKAKGMWMGGTPPIGYAPDNRSLAVVEDHAAIVRDIFQRYRRLGKVRLLAKALERDGIRSPLRKTSKGQTYGGRIFQRGQLYTILKNPVYVGDIAHKGAVYPGNHTGIISREEWEAVQRLLASNRQGHRRARQESPSWLKGRLFDTDGGPLIAVHTTKRNQRYRYYVSKALHHGERASSSPSLRIPAREVEQVVDSELRSLLSDPATLLTLANLPLTPHSLDRARARSDGLGKKGRPQKLSTMISRIVVHAERLEFIICGRGVAELLSLSPDHAPSPARVHAVPLRLTKTGHRLRLIEKDGKAAGGSRPNPALVRLLARGHSWWNELARGEIDVASLARKEKVTASYITRVVRLAFLAPQLVEAIIKGAVRADLDASTLLATGAITADWEEQTTNLLAD